MKAYSKLFRVPNVLMIGFTMVLMRYGIIAPILSVFQMDLQLPFVAFLSYVVATMLVAAAGYAINDYYDRNLDMVNRNPGDVVAGERIPLKQVMFLYRSLNILAIILAGIASYKAGVYLLTVIYLIVIGLLYFYTTTYKKQLLIGNIIVSIVMALVPFMVYLFEMPPVLFHYKFYIVSAPINLSIVSTWISGFCLFAFLSGLTREIIKDMEDFEGDRFAGRNTIPIVWGMGAAKKISLALMGLLILGIAVIYYFFFNPSGTPDYITLVYFSAFLLVPLCFNLYQLYKSTTAADYKFCGDLLKLIMLAGILYAPVVWFIIHRTFDS